MEASVSHSPGHCTLPRAPGSQSQLHRGDKKRKGEKQVVSVLSQHSPNRNAIRQLTSHSWPTPKNIFFSCSWKYSKRASPQLWWTTEPARRRQSKSSAQKHLVGVTVLKAAKLVLVDASSTPFSVVLIFFGCLKQDTIVNDACTGCNAFARSQRLLQLPERTSIGVCGQMSLKLANIVRHVKNKNKATAVVICHDH